MNLNIKGRVASIQGKPVLQYIGINNLHTYYLKIYDVWLF